MAPRAKKPKVTTTADTVVVTENALGGGLEGAERNSRELATWNPPIISPDRQINQVKDMADARGRDLAQNDGLMMGAIHTTRDSVIGSQFKLIAMPDYEVLGADEGWAEIFAQHVESHFNLAADSEECWFDAGGTMTLTDMLRLDTATMVITGEMLSTVEWDKTPGRPFSTTIQAISPTRLCNPQGKADDMYLRRGIERNSKGRPEAYHIRVGFPGDFFNPYLFPEWKRVEARKPWGRRQVIHIMERLQPDQSRGIADMVSAMKQMRMTKRFQDITLQNAVINATYAAVIESDLPTDVIFQSMGAGGNGLTGMLQEYMTAQGQYVAGAKNISIDGAKMPHLFPGSKLNLKPAGTPGGVGTSFEESLLRHTAASLGLSYEEFARDFSKTNYSSARASMAGTFKNMQGKKKTGADRKANAIYSLWMEEQMNAGALPLPRGFTADTWYKDPIKREALLACEWIGAARGQIDEMKETQAAILRIGAGLSTRQEETSQLGKDYRRVFKQLSREKKMAEKLGLEFTTDATKPGANDRQQTMDNEDQKPED